MSENKKSPTSNQDGGISSNQFRERLFKAYIDAEVQLIREVIENYTGQKMEKDDWRKVTRAFYMNDNSRYKLAFDEVQLGTVIYVNEKDSIGFRFEPVE